MSVTNRHEKSSRPRSSPTWCSATDKVAQRMRSLPKGCTVHHGQLRCRRSTWWFHRTRIRVSHPLVTVAVFSFTRPQCCATAALETILPVQIEIHRSARSSTHRCVSSDRDSSKMSDNCRGGNLNAGRPDLGELSRANLCSNSACIPTVWGRSVSKGFMVLSLVNAKTTQGKRRIDVNNPLLPACHLPNELL